MLDRWVPGLRAVRSYRVAWLPRDLTAGLVLATLLVPQGMAYATLAGLPPITGLYTTVFCLLAYAVFGPSRVLVLGPDSSLGPMIAAVLVGLLGANGDPARAVALASGLALLTGLMLTIAGVAKLGFLADLLSRPTQIGYLNGLALTILVSQLPKLFGFSVDGGSLTAEFVAFVRGVGTRTEPIALLVGVAGLAVILVLQRVLPRVPGVLVAVVGAIAAVKVFDLGAHGVRLIGPLPGGFPSPQLPSLVLSDVALLVGGAFGITLVSLADTISTASAFAARHGRQVRGNQEMVGIGAANLAVSLFQGFPVSTSGSRTAVAERAGAKTQLTGVVGAATIVVMLVVAPGLLRDLPQPILAAVVLAASLSLADLPGLVRLWRQRRIEFALALAAFVGVALFDVLAGIATAVALSVANVFRRVWWPYQTELGLVDGLDGYHDVTVHPDAARLPGLVLYRFDAPLIFANARTFRHEVRALAGTGPTWIVVAAEPITDIDTTAADMLEDLDQELGAQGITLVFAELKNPVRTKLNHYALAHPLDPAHFFHTLREAVEAFRARTGAEWEHR
ncbi:SulP family inorganic anion transporter [Cryptosporangium sp. NPDC051539]|uniref:SulP family inorganic anion transporter n=1 Tax=Cryptosporangium sp. NPDC051539 TaxID=3363962 RepID=UPI0037A365FA